MLGDFAELEGKPGVLDVLPRLVHDALLCIILPICMAVKYLEQIIIILFTHCLHTKFSKLPKGHCRSDSSTPSNLYSCHDSSVVIVVIVVVTTTMTEIIDDIVPITITSGLFGCICINLHI